MLLKDELYVRNSPVRFVPFVKYCASSNFVVTHVIFYIPILELVVKLIRTPRPFLYRYVFCDRLSKDDFSFAYEYLGLAVNHLGQDLIYLRYIMSPLNVYSIITHT